jgi:hypothetical protein
VLSRKAEATTSATQAPTSFHFEEPFPDHTFTPEQLKITNQLATRRQLNTTNSRAESKYGSSQAQDSQEGCKCFGNAKASLEETRL